MPYGVGAMCVRGCGLGAHGEELFASCRQMQGLCISLLTHGASGYGPTSGLNTARFTADAAAGRAEVIMLA